MTAIPDTTPEPIDVPIELDYSDLRYFAWEAAMGRLAPVKRMDLRSATTRAMDPAVVFSVELSPAERGMSLDELAARYPAPEVP